MGIIVSLRERKKDGRRICSLEKKNLLGKSHAKCEARRSQRSRLEETGKEEEWVWEVLGGRRGRGGIGKQGKVEKERSRV